MTLPGDDTELDINDFDSPPNDALELTGAPYRPLSGDPLRGLTRHQPDETTILPGGGSGSGEHGDGATKKMDDKEMEKQPLNKGKAPLGGDGGFPEIKGQEATDSVKPSTTDNVDDDAERMRILKGKIKVDVDYDKVGSVGGSVFILPQGPEPSLFRRTPICHPHIDFLFTVMIRGQENYVFPRKERDVDDNAERMRMRMLKAKMMADVDKLGNGFDLPVPTGFRLLSSCPPLPDFPSSDIESGQVNCVGTGAPSHNFNCNRIGSAVGGDELVNRDRDEHKKQVLMTWVSIPIGVATAVVSTIDLQKQVEKGNLRYSSLVHGLVILSSVSGLVSSFVGLGLRSHNQPMLSSFFIKLGTVAAAASLILLAETPFWGVLAWSIGVFFFLIVSVCVWMS